MSGGLLSVCFVMEEELEPLIKLLHSLSYTFLLYYGLYDSVQYVIALIKVCVGKSSYS